MSESDSDVEYIGDNIDSMPVPLDDDALAQVVKPFLPRLLSGVPKVLSCFPANFYLFSIILGPGTAGVQEVQTAWMLRRE